jgi:hypothetical protein
MASRLDGVTRAYPDLSGWGPGWPDCQHDKFVSVVVGGVRLRARSEVADLVGFLISRTGRLGYEVKPEGEPCGGTWGVACRAIKGTEPPVPSWHSWGLAVDINASCNPMSTRWRCNIPPAVVELWECAGFYWGGRYESVHDPMHFEYLGAPTDVAADLENARQAFRRLR